MARSFFTLRSTLLAGLCFFAVSTLSYSTSTQAAGFAILEQSAEGVGYAFAGSVVGYGDGSEIAFNPAAMSHIDGTRISHSSHLIVPTAEFTNMGSSNTALGGIPTPGGNGPDGGETAYIPSIYVVHELDEQIHLGFGIHSPFGLATEYDSTWVGRYHAIKSELTTIQLTPAVSYAVSDNFSIGAAFNVMYADVELSNAIDLGTVGFSTLGPAAAMALGLTPQGSDGFGVVDGDDWGVGLTLGSTYTYDDNGSRVGLAWRSRTTIDPEGNAEFTVPAAALPLTSTGLFTNTSANAHLSLPESITGGFVHHLDDRWAFLGELSWTRWSRFKELRINFAGPQPDTAVDEGWNNTWRYSLATAYKACDDLTASLGFTFDEEPIADAEHRTPRIPGSDRKWVAAGVNWDLDENLSMKETYAHLFISDASTDITNATGNNLVGEFDTAVDIVGIGIGIDYDLG